VTERVVHPYRSPEPPPPAKRPTPDADLRIVYLGFWLLSLVRVVAAWARHETFGAEATLAVLAVLVLPRMLLGRKCKRS
jgi:hypothetical protein